MQEAVHAGVEAGPGHEEEGREQHQRKEALQPYVHVLAARVT